MSKFLLRITHHTKNQELNEKRQGVDTNPEMTESLKLPDKNFKATIIKMFKQLQAITETQETNEIIWNLSKETESLHRENRMCKEEPNWIFNCVKIHITRNSLVFQWLGFGGFTAMAWVQSMVQELKSHSCAGQPKKKKIHTFIILTIFKCTFF